MRAESGHPARERAEAQRFWASGFLEAVDRTKRGPAGEDRRARACLRFDRLLRAGSLVVFQHQPFHQGRDRAVFRSRPFGQTRFDAGRSTRGGRVASPTRSGPPRPSPSPPAAGLLTERHETEIYAL